MATLSAPGIEPTRVRALVSGRPSAGQYVLYWMQSAQRVTDNPALAFAVRRANDLGVPVAVLFCLVPGYPDATSRHYRFMLEGLADVATALAQRGIEFLIEVGHPAEIVPGYCENAAMLVLDRGYMPVLDGWYEVVVSSIGCPAYQIETNVIVPVAVASSKQEYAARTIRRKIMSRMREYLARVELPQMLVRREEEVVRPDVEFLLAQSGAPYVDAPRRSLIGGENEALRLLTDFCENRLSQYDSVSRDPAADVGSRMSAYLHFGQISPRTVAMAAISRLGSAADAFIEQLAVRRELAINYVCYCPKAGSYEGLPSWCLKTLDEHRGDPRPVLYSFESLERAKTHDAYWNAAQREMVLTGRMHGYMRMYWGKKILEWSPTPEQAFSWALTLNDRYELDGRDPNGIVGVAWCFGLHDQPFRERPIFGKVRYMNAKGLERKFDMRAYLKRVQELEGET